MHTWFLGVLSQFYIFFPLLMMAFRKWMKNPLIVLTVLSLLLYQSPIDTIADKYHLIHCCFFELIIGHKSNYFNQTITIHQNYYAVNRLLNEEWQDKYVDLQSLTLQPNGTVPVFTPDHHYVTYGGKHLTPSGAQYYSKLLLLKKTKSFVV